MRLKKKSGINANQGGMILLVIPGLLFLLAFQYVPLFGLIIPFKNIDYAKGIFKSDWSGLKNFEFFFKSEDAWRVTRNTITLNFMFIAVTLVLSIALALVMFELGKREVKIYQTMIFVPYFVSWVVAGYVVYAFLDPYLGAVSNALENAGKAVPNFYNESKYWPVILLIAYVWKNIGYMTLLFYATLMGIDTNQFEAAALDGANKLQIALKISVPYLLPTIIMMTLLQIGKIFYADFGMFYFLTKDSGMLYPTTDVIDTYVFRALRISGNIGMSSAVGLYQSVVGFLLVLGSNLVVRKIDKDSALF